MLCRGCVLLGPGRHDRRWCVAARDLVAAVSYLAALREARGRYKESPPGAAPVWVSGPETASGVVVDTQSAMELSSFFACALCIGEDLGSLPRRVRRTLASGRRREAKDDPAYPLLNTRPNPMMSAADLWSSVALQMAVVGDAFCLVEWDRASRPTAIWPLRPDRVRVVQDEQQVQYVYRLDSGEEMQLSPTEVLHFSGPGWTGARGFDLAVMAHQVLGLAIAQDRLAGRFFAQGANVSGFVKTTHSFANDEARTKYANNLRQQYEGSRNSGRVVILEQGVDFVQSTMPLVHAQLLESRGYQAAQVAALFRMPPEKINAPRPAGSALTYQNPQQAQDFYVTECLMPRAIRIEQELDYKLLRVGNFVKHQFNALLRGDAKTRHEVYEIAKRIGMFNDDELRELEDYDPKPDGTGEQYYVPLNMIPATLAADFWSARITNPQQGDVTGQRDALAREVIAAARRRRAARDARAVEGASDRIRSGIAAFASWAEGYATKSSSELAAEASSAIEVLGCDAAAFSSGWRDALLESLRPCLTEADPVAAVVRWAREWPEEMSRRVWS